MLEEPLPPPQAYESAGFRAGFEVASPLHTSDYMKLSLRVVGTIAACFLAFACAAPDVDESTAEENAPDGPEEAPIGTDESALTGGIAKKVVYGKSARGQDLVAYKLTPAQATNKTAFLVFGVHGFEDAFDHDGRALYSIAHKMIKAYDAAPNGLAGWTVWIIPSANPDGMRNGKNNLREGAGAAFGRCTSEGQDLNRQFSTSRFDEHDALKALFEKAKPNVALDFHGWYNCTYGDKRLGTYFADSFNARYAGKPSKYCFTGSNGKMDCGPTLGGVFHVNTTIGDDLFAEWASSVKKVPAALVEYPAPDLNENGQYDTVMDEALGYRRMRTSTVDIFAGRTKVALDKLFATYR